MPNALLIVPPFWDPVCVPLGVSSLKSFAEARGHRVTLFDFNTVSGVFSLQRDYFKEGKRQFPYWENWNIERNGTEALSFHQMLYLRGRANENYREMIGEVLNFDERDGGRFFDDLKIETFDLLFERLYFRIDSILEVLLAQTNPDIVGCSVFNSTWPAALHILRKVKSLSTSTRTVVGGPGPLMGITSRPEEVQSIFDSNEYIDYWVIGEGEESFVQILDTPELPRQILDPQSAKSARLLQLEAKHMNEFLLPDYGELDVNRYLQLSIASSRGCPFKCSFCAETIFWKGFRSASPSRLAQTMKALASKYGRHSFYLCDSLSNYIIDDLSTELLASGEHFALDCYLRADKTCTDPARIRHWHNAGLTRARLGLETASQRLLNDMAKNTTVATMEESLRGLADSEVVTSTLWILGYPGEKESEFSETLSFIARNKQYIYQADAWLFQYHPYGLARSGDLESTYGSRPRFTSDLNRLINLEPRAVCGNLSSEERFDRLTRFVLAMRQEGVPNPYRVVDWLSADSRWGNLGYSNAVLTEHSVHLNG